MKPLKFKEQNIEFGKKQPQYNTLPGHLIRDVDGRFIFCMGLSLAERIRLLFTGKLWCSLLTFGEKLTPSHFTTKKSDYSKLFIESKKIDNYIQSKKSKS